MNICLAILKELVAAHRYLYLDALAEDGLPEKHKLGRENYYINSTLVDLLFNLPEME